jgi:phospholipid-translocating ATPase
MADIAEKLNSTGSITTEQAAFEDKPRKRGKKNVNRRDQSAVVRDAISCLALCHNVTPTFPNPANRKEIDFQASSPDEIALVKFAKDLNMKLVDRDQNQIVIENAASERETYLILANFPFSSDTKRMGIVLKHEKSGRIIFYLKGAETVMRSMVKPN